MWELTNSWSALRSLHRICQCEKVVVKSAPITLWIHFTWAQFLDWSQTYLYFSLELQFPHYVRSYLWVHILQTWPNISMRSTCEESFIMSHARSLCIADNYNKVFTLYSLTSFRKVNGQFGVVFVALWLYWCYNTKQIEVCIIKAMTCIFLKIHIYLAHN